jgi:hypothetical protein
MAYQELVRELVFESDTFRFLIFCLMTLFFFFPQDRKKVVLLCAPVASSFRKHIHVVVTVSFTDNLAGWTIMCRHGFVMAQDHLPHFGHKLQTGRYIGGKGREGGDVIISHTRARIRRPISTQQEGGDVIISHTRARIRHPISTQQHNEGYEHNKAYFTQCTKIVPANCGATPGPGAILVRNTICGVNASDVNYTNGMYTPGIQVRHILVGIHPQY